MSEFYPFRDGCIDLESVETLVWEMDCYELRTKLGVRRELGKIEGDQMLAAIRALWPMSKRDNGVRIAYRCLRIGCDKMVPADGRPCFCPEHQPVSEAEATA